MLNANGSFVIGDYRFVLFDGSHHPTWFVIQQAESNSRVEPVRECVLTLLELLQLSCIMLFSFVRTGAVVRTDKDKPENEHLAFLLGTPEGVRRLAEHYAQITARRSITVNPAFVTGSGLAFSLTTLQCTAWKRADGPRNEVSLDDPYVLTPTLGNELFILGLDLYQLAILVHQQAYSPMLDALTDEHDRSDAAGIVLRPERWFFQLAVWFACRWRIGSRRWRDAIGIRRTIRWPDTPQPHELPLPEMVLRISMGLQKCVADIAEQLEAQQSEATQRAATTASQLATQQKDLTRRERLLETERAQLEAATSALKATIQHKCESFRRSLEHREQVLSYERDQLTLERQDLEAERRSLHAAKSALDAERWAFESELVQLEELASLRQENNRLLGEITSLKCALTHKPQRNQSSTDPTHSSQTR
ncbi:MAG: hypothetical protein KDD69_02465 [Bdellovibrionales bacterium]|nr:hypothetical protein [Bdellovibrionales bacterium]